MVITKSVGVVGSMVGRLCGPVAAVGVLLSGGVAAGDTHVDALNAAVALIPGNTSLEATLFPAIAAVEVPSGLADYVDSLDVRSFVLDEAHGPGSASTRAWVASEPVQAMLEALSEGLEDGSRAMLSLPYGEDAVDSSWVDAGLYAPLGTGGVILGVRPEYARGFMIVHMAAVTDAWVRAEAGEGDEGLERFVELIRLYRLMMDRAMPVEVLWAMRQAGVAFEHLRDCVAVYWEDGAFTSDGLAQIATDLDERRIDIRRLEPPVGSRISAEQVLDRAFVPRGSADPQAFGRMMAVAEASGEPLRLFNAVAKWAGVAGDHVGTLETEDAIGAVWGDFSVRWAERWNSELLERGGPQLGRLDGREYSLLHASYGGLAMIHEAKRLLETESGGARLALGVVGFRLDNRRWPNALEAVQNYVTRVDLSPDWFNWDELQRRHVQMRFFVPVRDRMASDVRLEVEPHVMMVATHMTMADLEAAAMAAAASGEAEPFDFDSAIATVRENSPELAELLTTEDSDPPDSLTDAVYDRMPGDFGERTRAIEDRIDAINPMDLSALGELRRLLGEFMDLLVEGAAPQSGLDEDTLRELIIEAFRRQTIREARAAAGPMADSMSDDELLAMSGFEEMFGGVMGGGGPAVGFPVVLDESTFVLYSVGVDGTDGGAVYFGPAREEILFWPPGVTLERENGIR